jgi:hypothetical protein
MTDAWEQYAVALTGLHTARRAVTESTLSARQRRAARTAELERLSGDLQAQRERLQGLATELRAPLSAEQLTPLPGAPPLPWEAADHDARARIGGADAAVVDARRVARLPQLLPQWSSQLARATVVYLGFTLPNIAFVVLLSLAGVHGSTPVLVWFVVIWPLTTAIGGATTLGRVEKPRLPPDEATLHLARLKPPRHYPWLGVLLAWAGWLIPGWLMDQLLAYGIR